MKNLIDIPNSLINQIVDEWIKGEINQNVLKDRYINVKTYEKIAEDNNLSVSTVRRILRKYEPILFKWLDKELNKQLYKKEKTENISFIVTLPA